MKKTVLILGGSYFIGKKIKEILFKDGYQIFTLNRGSRPELNPFIINIKCDRNNTDEMKNILSEYTFDYIIDVSGLDKTQAEITCNAINLSTVDKYIYISSSAVYDIENCKIPIIEDSPLGKNIYWDEYGTNKIEAEEYLKNTFQQMNSKDKMKHELIILRPVYVYGEDNYAQRESFIFNQIVNNRVIVIPDNGDTKIQFICVDDLAGIVSQFLRIENLQKFSVNNCSIFNIGNKNAVTFNEWIEACEYIAEKKSKKVNFNYKKENVHIREFFPFYDYNNVLDVSKINKVYPYEMDFQDGLRKSFEWYLGNKSNIIFKENVNRKIAEIAEKELLC